jgi:hypothetical protein
VASAKQSRTEHSPEHSPEPHRASSVRRIFSDEEAVRRLIGRFPDRGLLRACYETGPGGYDLHRLLASMGVAYDVVAPSVIPKGGSDKVKRSWTPRGR